MTRTDAIAESMRIRPSRRRASLRTLLALPVALLLVAALATPAVAATSTNKEGLSKYEEPKKGPKHSKNKKPPHEPIPTPPPIPAKESSLPFTGYDLRWTVGFGLLLMGAGASIVVVQRRQRRGGDR
jgi:hypothetical protein